jgi:hypothetical protein
MIHVMSAARAAASYLGRAVVFFLMGAALTACPMGRAGPVELTCTDAAIQSFDVACESEDGGFLGTLYAARFDIDRVDPALVRAFEVLGNGSKAEVAPTYYGTVATVSCRYGTDQVVFEVIPY